jgi:hypothetical protein
MGILATAKGLYENKAIQGALLVFSFVSAIVSIVSASMAYSELSSATSEYLILLRNWERKPITALMVSSVPCPEGYSTLTMPKWPGTTSSACACPANAYSSSAQELQYSSITNTCGGNETEAGCISQPELDAQKMSTWRGSYLCYQRGGEGQLASPTTQRPIPTKAGKCDKGYKACGTGTYAKQRSTCVKDSELCPITGLDVSATTPEGFDASTATATGNGMSWFSRSSYTGEMPINQLSVALYKIDGKRGDCYGEDGVSQEKFGDGGASYGYINQYPSACGKVDNRWEVTDSQAESLFLQDNFDDNTLCTSSTQTADFIGSGTKCTVLAGNISGTPTSNTNCMAYGSTFTGDCASNDPICQNVVYQSSCGALGRWASQSVKYDWAILARHESYWKPDCEVSMVDLKKIEKPTETIKGSLLANVIICSFANFFLGILFPIFIFFNKFSEKRDVPCIPGEGEAEAKILNSFKKYLNVSFHIIKLVPAVLALITLSGISRAFAQAADGGCTDEKLTDRTFKDLNESMSASNGSLSTQVAIDTFGIVAAIAMTAYEWHSARRAAVSVVPDRSVEYGDDGEEAPEEEEGGTEMK